MECNGNRIHAKGEPLAGYLFRHSFTPPCACVDSVDVTTHIESAGNHADVPGGALRLDAPCDARVQPSGVNLVAHVLLVLDEVRGVVHVGVDLTPDVHGSQGDHHVGNGGAAVGAESKQVACRKDDGGEGTRTRKAYGDATVQHSTMMVMLMVVLCTRGTTHLAHHTYVHGCVLHTGIASGPLGHTSGSPSRV